MTKLNSLTKAKGGLRKQNRVIKKFNKLIAGVYGKYIPVNCFKGFQGDLETIELKIFSSNVLNNDIPILYYNASKKEMLHQIILEDYNLDCNYGYGWKLCVEQYLGKINLDDKAMFEYFDEFGNYQIFEKKYFYYTSEGDKIYVENAKDSLDVKFEIVSPTGLKLTDSSSEIPNFCKVENANYYLFNDNKIYSFSKTSCKDLFRLSSIHDKLGNFVLIKYNTISSNKILSLETNFGDMIFSYTDGFLESIFSSHDSTVHYELGGDKFSKIIYPNNFAN